MSRETQIEAPLGALLDALSIDHAKVHGWQTIVCCFHDESVPSLRVNIEEAGFACHACGAKGGSAFQFLMLLEDIDFPTAKKRVADLIGVTVGSGSFEAPRRTRPGRRGYVPKYKRKR